MAVVLDTNVWVSALLRPGSIPARAVEHAAMRGPIIFTAETLNEPVDVIQRPRISAAISAKIVADVFASIARASTMVAVREPIAVCRDPRDDKFIAAAVAGKAEYLVTGDDDLLALRAFRNVVITTPAEFVGRIGA